MRRKAATLPVILGLVLALTLAAHLVLRSERRWGACSRDAKLACAVGPFLPVAAGALFGCGTVLPREVEPACREALAVGRRGVTPRRDNGSGPTVELAIRDVCREALDRECIDRWQPGEVDELLCLSRKEQRPLPRACRDLVVEWLLRSPRRCARELAQRCPGLARDEAAACVAAKAEQWPPSCRDWTAALARTSRREGAHFR